MSETGATPAQIEAAQRRAIRDLCMSDEEFELVLASWGNGQETLHSIRNAAGVLVPPDHRIVSVADLAALLDITDDHGARLPDGEWSDAWDRIRALIGGAS